MVKSFFVFQKTFTFAYMNKYILTLLLFIGAVLFQKPLQAVAANVTKSTVISPVHQPTKPEREKLKTKIAKKLLEKKLKKHVLKTQSVGGTQLVVVILVALLAIILLALLGIDIIGLVIGILLIILLVILILYLLGR